MISVGVKIRYIILMILVFFRTNCDNRFPISNTL